MEDYIRKMLFEKIFGNRSGEQQFLPERMIYRPQMSREAQMASRPYADITPEQYEDYAQAGKTAAGQVGNFGLLDVIGNPQEVMDAYKDKWKMIGRLFGFGK